KAVEVVDPATVRLRLKPPNASILAALANAGNSPVSPTAYQKMSKDDLVRAPVGAGPFTLVEWKPSDRVVMERFPEYWRKGADGQPLPYVSRSVYQCGT